MSAQYNLLLDNPTRWDELQKESLKSIPNTLTIVSKADYTPKHKPGVMIAFAVEDVYGGENTVSVTISAKSLLLLVALLRGKHPELQEDIPLEKQSNLDLAS